MAPPYKGAKLTLTFHPQTHFNRILPLIIHNLNVKFEIDWGKGFVDRKPNFTIPSLNTHNLCVKSESDLAKNVVCMVPTSFYGESGKFNLDPMTQNQ